MKYCLLLLVFICSFPGFSQNINNTKQEIDSLRSILKIYIEKSEKTDADLKEKIAFQQKLNEQTLNTISTQLSSASYPLTLLGIVITIASVWLSVYVSNIEKRIISLRGENEKLLAHNQKIKNDVVELNDLIHRDIKALFVKIKREETEYILERLISVPEDITNVIHTLLSRELLPDDFSKLKKAYLKFHKDEFSLDQGYMSSYVRSYTSVLIQHFLFASLTDKDIRMVVRQRIREYASSLAFDYDILNSNKDLIHLIDKYDVMDYQKELNDYFFGISRRSKDFFVETCNTFFLSIDKKDKRFSFFNIIKSDDIYMIVKKEIGKLLYSTYINDNTNTDDEKKTLEECKQLLDIQ